MRGCRIHTMLNPSLLEESLAVLGESLADRGMAFEIVDMTLEERSKLRRLLADNLSSNVAVEEIAAPVPISEPVAVK